MPEERPVPVGDDQPASAAQTEMVQPRESCRLHANQTGDHLLTFAGPEMLERYRSWLGFLARMQKADRGLGPFSESDIVQQTMLEACRDLPQFRGRSEPELMAWLKKILAHVLAHRLRHDRADKRDLGREVSLEAAIEASSLRLAGMLADAGPSPSAVAMARESEVRLADLLEQLPADYREVIILRNIEGLAHEEIAIRLNRGAGAVRMLWLRALAKLKELLEVGGSKEAF